MSSTAMKGKSKNSRVLQYIPEIDGLRAIAVLAVFVYHLRYSWLPGGFIGVDVFFVISGYVVSKSLTTAQFENMGQYLARFYARRLIRILPALLVCLAATTIATVLFIPESWLSASIATTGKWAVFGAANIALLHTNDGYFAPRAEFNPFTQTWSLGVEEQFYLLFPLLFFVWLRFRSSRRQILHLTAWTVLALFSLASLVAAMFFSVNNPDRGFYSLLGRFWQMGAGALLFQWHYRLAFQLPRGGRIEGRNTTQALLLLLAGLTLIGVAVMVCRPAQVPWPLGLLPVAGTLLVLQASGLSHQPGSMVAEWLASGPARWVGHLSYSLYLWHWPVIVLMRWTVGMESLALVMLAVVLSVVLAMVSYYLVESPLRSSRAIKGLGNPVKIGAGITAVLLSLAGITEVFARQSSLTLSVTGKGNDWYPYGYEESIGSSAGKPLEGRTIFVVGDSHAEAYTTMLLRAQQKLGLRPVIIYQAECEMGRLIAPRYQNGRCFYDDQAFMKKLREEGKPGDLVFLASLRLPRLRDQGTAAISEAELLKHIRSPESEELRNQGLAETLDQVKAIKAIGLRVMIDLPKPVFKTPPFRCSDWFNQNNPICEQGFDVQREFIQNARRPVINQIAQLKTMVPGLVVWDPLPVLCPKSTCNAFAEGRPLFFDGDHLSAHGNRLLYGSFVKSLAEVWPQLPHDLSPHTSPGST